MGSDGVKGEFAERIYLKFKASGKGTRSDELIAELVESLSLKKAMGVHNQWIRQAILDQFIRERNGVVLLPEKTWEDELKNKPASQSGGQQPKNVATRATEDQAGESSKPLEVVETQISERKSQPKSVNLGSGMSRIMG